MTTGRFLWSLSNGVLILGISGAFWVGLGLGQPARAIGIVPWLAVLAIMVGGVAAFGRSAFKLRKRSNFRGSDFVRTDPQTWRTLQGYRNILVLEAALAGAAVFLCFYFRHQELLWPAIGVAVSLHFAPFARLFYVPAYYVTSCIGTLVSTVALCAPFGQMRLVWLGVGMCTVTWGTALYFLQRADAIAAHSLASSQRTTTLQ